MSKLPADVKPGRLQERLSDASFRPQLRMMRRQGLVGSMPDGVMRPGLKCL